MICIFLTIVPSVSADYIGVTTVNKIDPETEFLCVEGNGDFVPGPLTVCNVYAAFDDPDNVLLSLGNADLQVYNGANPDVFFQHPFNFTPLSPACAAIPAFPDLICDSFVTIGIRCGCAPPCIREIITTDDFDAGEFSFNGHIVGGWSHSHPSNPSPGVAGLYPDLQVLFLQSSVVQGLSLSGDIDIFWAEHTGGDVYAEIAVPVECAATCGSCPTDSDGDGDTDAADLAVLLGNWGPVDAGDCQDTDDNGLIDAFDLAILLGSWGPCP